MVNLSRKRVSERIYGSKSIIFILVAIIKQLRLK